ncbi:MAG: zinc-ribbon domain-containing protein [Oscillospiraceae bacterium]
MFFFAVIGTSQKKEDIGTFYFSCPRCNHKQGISVSKSYNYFHVFFIPIFRFGVEYNGICNSCGSEFYIDNKIGKLLDKRLMDFIDDDCVHEKQIFSKEIFSPSCPACHSPVEHDDFYCRKCGYKL